MLLNVYMFYTLFGSEKNNKKTKQKNTTKKQNKKIQQKQTK